MTGVLRGLTQRQAATDPASADRRLRGRTYAIPFDAVWSAALRIVGEMRAWTVRASDDQAGIIEIEARTMVWKVVDDVTVSIGLDGNAQTRVDLSAMTRSGKADLGRNARGIGSFLKRLDKALEVQPQDVLDPTIDTSWQARP